MNFEEISKSASKIYAGIVETNNQAKEWLKEVLSKQPDKSVKVIISDDIDLYSVPYDGGNHPEYNTNVFSTVRRVFLNDKDEIILDTEDCYDYPLADAQGAGGGLVTYEVAEYVNMLLGMQEDNND